MENGIEMGNSMDCIVLGVAKSRTQLSDFHFISSAFCSHQEAVCLSADHTSAAPTGKPCQSGTPHPQACIFPLWTSRLTYQETRRCLSGKVQSRVGFSYQGYLSYKNFKMHESTSHTARTGKNVIVKTCERVGGTKPTILHKEVKGRKRMELIFFCFLLWNVTLHTCHFLRSSPISGKSLKRIPLAEAQIVGVTVEWCRRGWTTTPQLSPSCPTAFQASKGHLQLSDLPA